VFVLLTIGVSDGCRRLLKIHINKIPSIYVYFDPLFEQPVDFSLPIVGVVYTSQEVAENTNLGDEDQNMNAFRDSINC